MTTATHLIDGTVLVVKKAGSTVGTRTTLNLIEGSNVTLTVADNSGSDRVDVTVAASSSGGVTTFNTRSGAVTLTEADVEGALTNVSFGSAQLQISGTKVVGAQGAAVADATGAGDIIAQFNACLARLRAHGLIAT